MWATNYGFERYPFRPNASQCGKCLVTTDKSQVSDYTVSIVLNVFTF